MEFFIVTVLIAFVAGLVASIAGFGIGSLLTPLLAIKVGTKLAVAAVVIPHFGGTVVRCWLLRKSIDKQTLIDFGITSAIGGLLGALLHNFFRNPLLTLILGFILTLSGVMGLSDIGKRVNLPSRLVGLIGAVSGIFGGLVGNQGGIRSLALTTFKLDPISFVATATAIGLLVDIARMPV